jgi:Xaa-Pro aminopeptidase
MAKLIYANTKQGDMRYVLGMEIPDACFYLEVGDKKCVFLDGREIGAFEEKNKNANLKGILSDTIFAEARKNEAQTSLENKVALYLIKKNCSENEIIEVPNYLPLDMADFLRSEGINLSIVSPFFPQRAIKTSEEISIIEDNIQKTIKAYNRIEKILQDSSIDGDKIIYQNQVLTSEFIKIECDRVLLEEGMFNEMNIIISSGIQASMPHNTGSGQLLANAPIICDIFPRNRSNGYFADMTRTYVKGLATEEFKKMYDSVLAAQNKAFDLIASGVEAKSVYDAVCKSFIQDGFDVGEVGFVHGVGHGLGLDIHELPYINASYAGVLEEGNVVTVEPGLYYAAHGGVRIEDVVVVTENRCKNLTNYPKNFQID